MIHDNVGILLHIIKENNLCQNYWSFCQTGKMSANAKNHAQLTEVLLHLVI